jgi:hypothetical protein
VILLSVGFLSTAQQENNVQTENEETTQKEKDYKWKFLLSLDGRKSIVLGENTELGGLKIGATLNNKYKMGVGLYWMKENIERNGTPGGDITNAKGTLYYKFGYTSLFFEPVKTLSRRWQLSAPLHIGSAVIESRYLNNLNERQLFMTTKVPLFEFSGVAQYKFYRWLAVGTGIGYRSFLVEDEKLKQALNAPVYILQLKILFGVIWKALLNQEIDDGWDD